MTLPSGWNGNSGTVGTWPLGDVAGEIITNQTASFVAYSGTLDPSEGLEASINVQPTISDSPYPTTDDVWTTNTSILTASTTPALAQLAKIRGSASDNIKKFATIGDDLYFISETDPDSVPNLFKFSRSTNKIVKISDIQLYNDEASTLAVLSGKLYFSGSVNGYYKLCMYNPSTNTITQVSDLRVDESDLPTKLTAGNGVLYFVARAAGDVGSYPYTKLHKYDPSNNTTTLLSNIYYENDEISNLVVVGSDLYFVEGSIGKLLKYSSGTITQVSDINTSGPDSIGSVSLCNGVLYFSASADGGSIYKIYSYNPISNQVIQIEDISGAAYGDSQIVGVNGGTVYIQATYDTGNNLKALYSYTYGYEEVIFTKITNGLTVTSLPGLSIGANFYCAGGSGTNKLQKLNATAKTITQITNINPSGSDGFLIPSLYDYNGDLTFSSYYSATPGVWRLFSIGETEAGGIELDPESPDVEVLPNGNVLASVTVDPTIEAVIFNGQPLPEGSVLRNTSTTQKFIKNSGALATDFTPIEITPKSEWSFNAVGVAAWGYLQSK